MPMIRVNNVAFDASEVVLARYFPDGYDNGPTPGLLVRFKTLVDVFHGEEARLLWAFLGAAPSGVQNPEAEAGGYPVFIASVTRYVRAVGRFYGTVGDLLNELRRDALNTDFGEEGLPVSPKALSHRLRRSMDSLDEAGVVVRFRSRSNQGRRVDLFWLPVGERKR
mgnify:CR=1 FL=1